MKKIKLSGLRWVNAKTANFGDGTFDAKETLTGLLKTIYKMDDAKIAEIIKDDATGDSVLTAIVEVDKARILGLKPAQGETFQDGYKKGKKEVLQAFETKLKEKYGVTSDLEGDALVQHIVEVKTGEAGVKGEEAIKASPTYLALEKKLRKEITDMQEAHKTELANKDAAYKKERDFEGIAKSALTVLDGLKPVLPADATVAANQKNIIVGELKAYDWVVNEAGTPVPHKEGKVVMDAHGNVESLDNIVKTVSGKYFVFEQNNGGDNAGNSDAAKKAAEAAAKSKVPYPTSITKPKTFDELQKVIQGTTLKPEEKRVVMDTWQAENKK